MSYSTTPFWANWAEMQLFPRFSLLYALAISFILIFPRLPCLLFQRSPPVASCCLRVSKLLTDPLIGSAMKWLLLLWKALGTVPSLGRNTKEKQLLYITLTSLLGTVTGVPSFTTPASTTTPTTIGPRELKICWGIIRSLHGNTAMFLNSSRFFCLSSWWNELNTIQNSSKRVVQLHFVYI